MPVSSIHLGPFSRSKAGQRMSQCWGELTARRLGAARLLPYTHGTIPTCKMKLCPSLCAANASSLCLAAVSAGMLSASLHHQSGQALLQTVRRWMSFSEGKIVAVLHIAALSTFY